MLLGGTTVFRGAGRAVSGARGVHWTTQNEILGSNNSFMLRRPISTSHVLSRGPVCPSCDGEPKKKTYKRTFMGIDLSTQRLKALIIGDDFRVLHEAEVDFDKDLPEFKTKGGAIAGAAGAVTAPPLMWVKSLDMVMHKLRCTGVDFSKVKALSGDAQQHGSVWWAKGANDRLKSLQPNIPIHKQLDRAFLIDSPIWMDASTSADCKALEEAVGGPKELAKVTGSRAYERFTGPQIRKMFCNKPDIYKATERISLVSSFAASLFLGRVAPIDYADGSGMNLLDIHKNQWWDKAVCAVGDKALFDKLGKPVPAPSVIGEISKYFVKRYGFSPDCKVVAFTGDNNSAFAALRLKSGYVGLSLGTSDTLLLAMQHAGAPEAGHVLISSTPYAKYMALLCFSNGSLTRKVQRDRLAGKSWGDFAKMLSKTPKGNSGHMGIYYETAEIIPRCPPGKWLYNADGTKVDKLSPEVEARAVFETQCVARRVAAEDMGFKLGKETRIIATGGAAANQQLLQIFADVFNAPVFLLTAHGNAAMLGAAIRAADVWSKDTKTKLKASAEAELSPAAKPSEDAEKSYSPLIKKYREIVKQLPKLSS